MGRSTRRLEVTARIPLQTASARGGEKESRFLSSLAGSPRGASFRVVGSQGGTLVVE